MNSNNASLNALDRENRSRSTRLILYSTAIALVMGWASVPEWGRPAVFLLLALWALRSPLAAMQALTLSWLLLMLSPWFVEDEGGTEILRWLVMGVAFFRSVLSALHDKKGFPFLLLPFAVFTATTAATSFAVSYALDVSLMKLAIFFVGGVTVLLGMHRSRQFESELSEWFSALALVLVVGGFPLIFMDIGYLRNDRGFQGLLNHPQAYGIFLAIVVSWFLARLLFGKERNIVVFSVVGLGSVSLLATEARTALLAVVGALAITLLLRVWRRREGSKWIRFFTMTSLVMSLVTFASPQVQETAINFIFKGQTNVSVSDAFAHSRGRMISRSYENFLDHPLIGIGFGVASDPTEFVIQRDPIFGFPVSASIEKGFVFIALVEETGVVGLGLFSWFLLVLLRRPVRAQSPISLVMAIAALLVNFGEAVLFSFGGMGLFIWLMLGYTSMVRR